MPDRLLIAPFLSGQNFCDAAVDDPAVRNDDEAAFHAAALGQTGAHRIEAMLSRLGPRVSPSGRYGLGYTLIISLLRYFIRTPRGWELAEDVLRNTINTITQVDRDVVVYLSANHFTDANVELVRELAADPENLMWGRDGPMPIDDYFNHPVVAWTASNMDAPITRMRTEAITAACRMLMALPPLAQSRIAAVSLLGEVHDMFPQFEGGPSQKLRPVLCSDYAPAAVTAFQHWLRRRFRFIWVLNRRCGTHYSRFTDVQPPRQDHFDKGDKQRADHLDLQATGKLSIFGWVHDALDRPIEVEVHIDGKRMGMAETGLNRTDVVEHISGIVEPNVGFRFDLDYRPFRRGRLTVDIVVNIGNGPRLHLARRHFTVVKPGKLGATPVVNIPSLDLPSLAADGALQGYLDGPNEGTRLVHNPLAALWVLHRNDAIRAYFDYFVRVAVEAGITLDLLFSHQVAPNLYGTWNADLVRTDGMQDGRAPYGQGITLYGGATYGPAFDRLLRRKGWRKYGVSEMHPGIALPPAVLRSIFQQHRKNGALFVAPFHLSVVPERLQPGSDLVRFQIDPRNSRAGSDHFWQAIVEQMRD